MTRNHVPVWFPLEAAVRPRQLGGFMWMFDVALGDGTRVHAYKHVDTRRYLHLSECGRAFAFTPTGKYKEAPLAGVVEATLPDLQDIAERDDWCRRRGIAESTTWDPMAMRLDVGLTDEESATLAAYARGRGLDFRQALREIVVDSLVVVRRAGSGVG